jgi:L-iditol 2-dehydrogenase
VQALLLSRESHLEMADVPQPEVGPRDVLVRVQACGICGSDIHGYDGSSGRRIPPLVMGHEAAGEVAAVGADVTRFRAGERVTFDSMIWCGECRYCKSGQTNLCDNRQVLGVSCGDYRRHGAFAEYVVVPEHIVYHVPDEVSPEMAAMVEPVSVAVHAVSLAQPGQDETAVVVGTGMIGLLVVQAIRAAGCERVIAVDIDDDRLDVARQLGATETIRGDQADPVGRIRELTGGHGADVSFEVVGATEPLRTAIESLRKGGRVVIVGNISPKVELPLQAVVTRELTLYGSCASANDYPRCMELMARGAIDVRPLISAVAPLTEGPQWFERLHRREKGLMKVVLRP